MHRLKLFGGISIETDSGPVTGRAVQRRRLALLALLSASRAGGMSRDKLVAYLWPDADAENGRRFLSDSVYRINKALEDVVGAGDAVLAVGDVLRLDPQRLPSDVGEFEDALARMDYETAVVLYTGPFLDGFFLSDAPEFELWAEGERERFAREYARALEALAVAAQQKGEGAAAANWWRKLAAQDPYNSRVALRLMQALDAAGERGAAIQHARVHETLLREELEIEPDSAVRALADTLRFAGSGPAIAATQRAELATPPPLQANTPVSLPASAAAPEAPPSAPRPRRLVQAALLWGALGVVAVASLAIWARGRANNGRTAATPMRSIAVLPFANLSADKENEYFSDGITEEIISALGKTDGLEVASRTSVFAFKNRPVDVRDVGKQLGVATVVEGSVRKSGRQLRITAQLVNTASGYKLWSEAYDREMDEVFAIQEEISRAIVAKLLGTLAGARDTKATERPTADPEAYDLYLRGRFEWHRRTQEGLGSAVDYFSRAVARAPGYARAYVGLADAYAVSAFYDYLAPREAYPKAEAAARRALETDPSLAAPHATLGYVLTYYHLDWPRAEEEFQRSIALDPSYSTAHQWYANLLTVAGRFGEAEREMRFAQEADPLSLIANAALGWSFYHAGKYDAALEQYRRTLALDPTFALPHLWGGWALQALGREEQAREWIDRAVQHSRGSVLTRLALAHVLAGSSSRSEQDSALAIVREIESHGALGEYVPSYEIGKVHLALGDRDKTLDWLERANEERSHSMAFLRVDPQLARLRGDERFEKLVMRVTKASSR